ncbi:MAG TPA: M48 family metallopeptidase [Rhizomicrobium sp.]
MLLRYILCALIAALLMAGTARAQAVPYAAPTVAVSADTLPDTTPKFDAALATQAYLAQMHGAARARSDAYFEGGYWLRLVDVLYVVILSGLLLWLHIAAGMRDWAQNRTRSRTGQTALVILLYAVIAAILIFPLAVYQDYFREHAYGLSNQSIWQWLGDFAIAFGVGLVAALVLGSVIYAVIRRAPYNWWIWAAGIVIAFQILTAAIYPVFIAPLFNHYAPLPDGALKNDILSLARANGVPGDKVFVMDASRQSPRLSANVSGFLGTTRITLNDNLLRHATHDEIMAVVGHEMGHYVLDHTTRLLILMGMVIFLGFAFVHWGFVVLTDFFGGNWDMRSIEDPAGLPLLVALAAIFLLLMTPVTNTIVRTTEIQADMFGVNAVRKPDAFASVTLKLAAYRKLDPTPLEEFIFYDHPSGRSRIAAMMRWKAEHLNDPDIRYGAVSPQ